MAVPWEMPPLPHCSEHKRDSCKSPLEPVHGEVAASPFCVAQDHVFVVSQQQMPLLVPCKGPWSFANAMGERIEGGPSLLQGDEELTSTTYDPHIATDEREK